MTLGTLSLVHDHHDPLPSSAAPPGMPSGEPGLHSAVISSPQTWQCLFIPLISSCLQTVLLMKNGRRFILYKTRGTQQAQISQPHPHSSSKGGIKQCHRGLRHTVQTAHYTPPSAQKLPLPSRGSPRKEMFPAALVGIFFGMCIYDEIYFASTF